MLEEGWPLQPHVVADRELLTGQGPTSATRLGQLLVAKLREAA